MGVKNEKVPGGPSLTTGRSISPTCGDLKAGDGLVSVVEWLASEKHVLEWIFKLYHAFMLAVQVLRLEFSLDLL